MAVNHRISADLNKICRAFKEDFENWIAEYKCCHLKKMRKVFSFFK